MSQKKLILVGAGPGDAELISLKGIKALQQANVVMYDALVSEELLQHAPNAIHVFCGKRAGTHYMKQDEINQQIVENANKHGVVVRLKGGDPFVFGRGQEEIEYAERANWYYEKAAEYDAVKADPNKKIEAKEVDQKYWIKVKEQEEKAGR